MGTNSHGFEAAAHNHVNRSVSKDCQARGALTDVFDDAVVVGELGVTLPESLAVGADLLLSLALDLTSNLCQVLPPILQCESAHQDTFHQQHVGHPSPHMRSLYSPSRTPIIEVSCTALLLSACAITASLA